MMGKFLGALLICGAGAWSLGQKWRQGREEERFYADMAAALEQMETAIRFRHLPMPALLREQGERTACGFFFIHILQCMKRDMPLQISWIKSTENIPFEGLRTILLTMELTGDVSRLCANLRRCAEEVRQALRETAARRGQRQKLSLALTASACGLLVILLL